MPMLDRMGDTAAHGWQFPGIESLEDWAQQLSTIPSATLANLRLLLIDSEARLSSLTARPRASVPLTSPTTQSGRVPNPSVIETPEPAASTSQRSIRPRRKPASEVPVTPQPIARPTVQLFVNAIKVRTSFFCVLGHFES